MEKMFIILLFSLSFQALMAQDIVKSGARISIIGPATLTESGEYFLARDSSGPITVAANDIVVDLNNRVISGGFRGVEIDGVENITIQNGTIQNTGDSAIACQNSQNTTFKNLLIDEAGSSGILLISCTGIFLDNVQCQRTLNGATGVSAANIHQLFVQDSIFKDNALRGLAVNSGSQIMIMDSLFLSNALIGLNLVETQSSIIQSCIAENNANRGISIDNSFNIILKDNQSHNNVDDGIGISGSNFYLQNNITNNNGAFGINNSGTDNSFFNNKAQQNSLGNFSNVPIQAVFDMSLEAFTVNSESVFDNISVIP